MTHAQLPPRLICPGLLCWRSSLTPQCCLVRATTVQCHLLRQQPVLAAPFLQGRKCGKCGSEQHRSDNRVFPNYQVAQQLPQALQPPVHEYNFAICAIYFACRTRHCDSCIHFAAFTANAVTLRPGVDEKAASSCKCSARTALTDAGQPIFT